jgi:hypothetical protein
MQKCFLILGFTLVFSIVCCSKEKSEIFLGVPLSKTDRILIKREGRPLPKESEDYKYFFSQLKKYSVDNPKVSIIKKIKSKKYYFDIEAIEKDEKKPTDPNLKVQYVIQISLFELKSKNKVGEHSFDCCD